MNRLYISHNNVYHYYLINIKTDHPAPENQNNHIVFKGRDSTGALKAAQRYCDECNKTRFYRSWVDKIIKETDYRGR